MNTTRPNLLLDRRFSPFFWTQFFGAFNDNIFKNALVIFITMKSFSLGSVSSEQMVALCGGIFILPFFVFSATAGQLADKLSKTRIVVWVKIWEIVVMSVGAYGFINDRVGVLLVTLFFMGLHSAFFGPVKYSILPQLLTREELVSGNAYVEMGTFLAILLGTLLGGLLIAHIALGRWLVSAVVLAVATAGLYASQRIQPLGAAAPSLSIQFNPLPLIWDTMRRIHAHRSVFVSILGISWFWFFGAGMLSILPSYCKQYLQGSETLITLFLALFSVGIGIGSLLCGRLSARKLELGLVPCGSLGISLFCFDLFLVGSPGNLDTVDRTIGTTILGFLTTTDGLRIAVDLLFLAISGGVFIVPLYTLIQQRSAKEERSRVIAGNNILNAFFMVCAAAVLVILFRLEFSIPQIFMLFCVLNVVVTTYIYIVVPEFLFRCLSWGMTNLVHRVEIIGSDRLPMEGPAVLFCNHMSYLDWLIIASACPRPIRFVVYRNFLQNPLLRWIFRDTRVIPIAGAEENPAILDSACKDIATELRNGQIVCVFRQGSMIWNQLGDVLFAAGIERMLRERPVPVLCLALRGPGRSIPGGKGGKVFRKPFCKLRLYVSLAIDRSMPPGKATCENPQELPCELPDAVD